MKPIHNHRPISETTCQATNNVYQQFCCVLLMKHNIYGMLRLAGWIFEIWSYPSATMKLCILLVGKTCGLGCCCEYVWYFTRNVVLSCWLRRCIFSLRIRFHFLAVLKANSTNRRIFCNVKHSNRTNFPLPQNTTLKLLSKCFWGKFVSIWLMCRVWLLTDWWVKPMALNFDFYMTSSLNFKNLTMAHGSIAGANAFSLSITPPSFLTHNKGAWIILVFQSSKRAPLMISATLCTRYTWQSFIQSVLRNSSLLSRKYRFVGSILNVWISWSIYSQCVPLSEDNTLVE